MSTTSEHDAYVPGAIGRAPNGATIAGVVTEHGAPVAGAVVRVQATSIETRAGADGRFTLRDIAPGTAVTITAWAPGYFIGGGLGHLPGAADVVIELEPHAHADNPD